MDESVVLIVSKLEELIQATGGRIETFYPYVVRQQILYGIANVIALIVTIVLLTVGFRLGNKIKWQEEYPNFAIAILCSIVGGIGTVMGGIFFVSEGLHQLLNPHFYAVQSILEMSSSLLK